MTGQQTVPTATARVDAAAVVAGATRRYLAGRPIDMSELALDLGVSRATLYRRVGNHEELLGAVLAEQTERTFRSVPGPGAGTGVDRVHDVLAGFVRAVVGSPPLQALIDRDPTLFVRVVMGPGPVEDRGVAMVEGLVTETLGDALAVPVPLLARGIVRMSDATMYAHLLSRQAPELDDLFVLIRMLLDSATGRAR